MDVINFKVDIVIEVFDAFSGERKLSGTVWAVTGDNIYAMKKEGCFIFCSLPTGVHHITVGGERYISRELDIEVTDKLQLVKLSLMPSRNYIFPETAVRLYGRLSGSALIVFPEDAQNARLLEEFKRGETVICAFFSEGVITAERKMCFCNKKNVAAYFLKHLGGTEYETDRALEYSIGCDTLLGTAYELTPDSGGGYIAAAKGRYKTALLYHNGRRTEIKLTGGQTEYDILE